MPIKLDEDERAGFDILCTVIPSDLAESVIKSRRRKKAMMTARIASRLIKEYQAYGNPEEAAEIHISKAWVDFKSEWAKKPSRYADPNHPSPRGQYVSTAAKYQTREEYLAAERLRVERTWQH